MAVDVLEDLLEEDDEVVQVSGEVKSQLFSPCEKMCWSAFFPVLILYFL